MADLSITPADVELVEFSALEVVQVGEAVDRGEVGYLKGSDSKYWLAQCDVDDESAAAAVLFHSAASTDGWAIAQRTGKVELGAVLTQGVLYYLSATPGKIAPVADIATGQRLTTVIRAIDGTTAQLQFGATGIVAP